MNADFYLAFENKFRGDRDLIIERQRRYLRYLAIQDRFMAPGKHLDLGCGRCEWLELLHDNNYDAIGVDANASSIKYGLDRGFKVYNREIFSYLSECPDNSFSSVSLFQVVEHFTIEQICLIIEEIHRVLTPGGVSIVETVNPQNVSVSTHNFYLDPTHQRPVPPLLLEFIHNYNGFDHAFFAGANKSTLGRSLRPGLPILRKLLRVDRIVNLLNSKFYVSPDYAVVSIKNGKNVSDDYVELIAACAQKSA